MPIITIQQNITPEQATKWLNEHFERLDKKEFNQRSLMTSIVYRYANEMSNGNWLLCPQPIVFDEKDNLLDGQHRLAAIQKHGKPVMMMVSTGWPAAGSGSDKVSTMDVIDRGKNRSIGQQLQIHGYINANNYAACVAQMARMCWNSSVGLTVPGVLFVLNKLDMQEHIDRILTKTETKRDFKGGTVGLLAYYHTVAPKKAEEFADDLFNFTAEKGSPVQAYLRWIKGPRHRDENIKGFCACLRAWHENNPLSLVRPNAEAAQYISDLNPKLKENIRKAIFRNRSHD